MGLRAVSWSATEFAAITARARACAARPRGRLRIDSPPPPKCSLYFSLSPAGLSEEDDAFKTDFSPCHQNCGGLRRNLPTGLTSGQPRSETRGQWPKSPLFLITT